jgi:hypothetical protein
LGYYSNSPTSGYISKGNEISIPKRYLHAHVTLFAIAIIWSYTVHPSTDEWIKNSCYIYIMKNGILSFAKNMDET